MLTTLKKHTGIFVRRLSSLIDSLIGESDLFNLDQRLFNSILLISAVSYIIRIFINILIGVKMTELILSHLAAIISFIIIFYFSRVLNKLKISRILFISVIMLTFSINWLYSGGSAGVMPFYYLCLLTIIVIVTKRKFKKYVISIILLNVSLLIFLEYRHPHIILENIDKEKSYIYKFSHYLFVSLVTVIILQVSKTMYRQENTSDAEFKVGSQNQENGNGKLPEVLQNLTIQERKVLELIMEGRRNKEIAAVLYVDLSTVKTHINNIYKKIGVSNRSGILKKVS
jgi:DNA-binding NarL/FixJ family response regulator